MTMAGPPCGCRPPVGVAYAGKLTLDADPRLGTAHGLHVEHLRDPRLSCPILPPRRFPARLRFLNVGLAGVLVFVGGKMLVSGVAPIPVGVSLAVVAILPGAAMAASVMCRERQTQARAEMERAGLPSLDSRAT